jgi:transcriptional regulator with XRE-family HTH domain
MRTLSVDFRLKAEYNVIKGREGEKMLASENKTIVREYRESKGLSIKEVSKGAKIPIGTLYDVEIGRRSLKANKAKKKMADFLEVPIEKLFKPTYYRAIPITD